MKTLLLVGGGHAHLYVIQKLRKRIEKGLKVVLISDKDMQYYSGMAARAVAGDIGPSDMGIALKLFCEAHQVTFIKGKVMGVNTKEKTAQTQEGEVFSYDWIAFDVGSEAKKSLANKHAHFVKPLSDLKHLMDQLSGLKMANAPIEMVVVGTGDAGIEIGFAAYAFCKSKALPCKLTFVGKKPPYLRGLYPEVEWVSRDLAESLMAHGCDVLIEATGIQAPELFKASEMATDADGYLLVNECLQSLCAKEVFGAGDCVALSAFLNLPKNGVYAIRQAKVLAQNLLNAVDNKPLVAFYPQKRYLSIVDLGLGQAAFRYGRLSIVGRWPYHLKKWIDDGYMKKIKRRL